MRIRIEKFCRQTPFVRAIGSAARLLPPTRKFALLCASSAPGHEFSHEEILEAARYVNRIHSFSFKVGFVSGVLTWGVCASPLCTVRPGWAIVGGIVAAVIGFFKLGSPIFSLFNSSKQRPELIRIFESKSQSSMQRRTLFSSLSFYRRSQIWLEVTEKIQHQVRGLPALITRMRNYQNLFAEICSDIARGGEISSEKFRNLSQEGISILMESQRLKFQHMRRGR